MTITNRSEISSSEREDLLDRLEPRLKVEEYFRRSRRTFRKSRSRLWFNINIKKWLFKVAFQVAGIYGRGVRNGLAVQVRRLELRFPDLPPAFDGFRIMHLSDLHIDEMDGLAEALAPLLQEAKADLCVLTGDYRYEIFGPCDEIYPRMRSILSNISTRFGAIGILGNHDAAEIALRLEDMGVKMLVNDAVEIEKGGDTIWIAGLDDQFDYRCADLPKAVSPIPAHAFSVLLAHDPTFYDAAAASGVRLYLCGHTHAGQVRVPFLGAVKKNAPVPRQFVQDRWTYKDMQGYTSWGAGCSTLPVRYNCPPEVAILTLTRAH